MEQMMLKNYLVDEQDTFSFKKNLTTGSLSPYFMNKNQCPVNVIDATDIMNNHPHDNYRSQVSNIHNHQN